MNDSLLEKNLRALGAVYPGQVQLLRGGDPEALSDAKFLGDDDRVIQDEQARFAPSRTELHLVDRFADSPLARRLFDAIQLDNLSDGGNRRLILLEDRPGHVRRRFEAEDWRSIIQSEICFFLIAPNLEENLRRLLHRYPDIAAAIPEVYSGDGAFQDGRREFLLILFDRYRAALDQRGERIVSSYVRKSSPFPTAVRFFTPGHNYLQDACVEAFRQLGYEAERLQWRKPLYRFVRSTAWLQELDQHPFDLAVFLNSTPATFGAQKELSRIPLQKAVWFVDNPRRYVYEPADLEGCSAVGVFDRTYIPYLRERCQAPVIEVRTGYGVDPASAKIGEPFRSIDVAFVGELGLSGIHSIERGLALLDPHLLEAANDVLKDLDVARPIYMSPIVEEALARGGWKYRGFLVEYLENKATALRRRYYLEILADQGLVVFGGGEWRDDPSAGPLRSCYGGRRIRYGPELASLYASVKININIFHVQCVSAPNPRVYDVLASGGFLLTTEAPGLLDEFEEGKDLVVFRSREELREKVAYYLSHPKEREAVSRRGQETALASCGRHDRMQRLLKALSDSLGESYVYLC
ncbi:MAG: glycosyltransferase [Candidatus Omnitrophica bacterium]|nr:glycosyltransferase [Candidatus Omnitrophota bacterium]